MLELITYDYRLAAGALRPGADGPVLHRAGDQLPEGPLPTLIVLYYIYVYTYIYIYIYMYIYIYIYTDIRIYVYIYIYI